MNYKKKIQNDALNKIDERLPENPRFDTVKVAPKKNVMRIALPVAAASLIAVAGTATGLSLYYSSLVPAPNAPAAEPTGGPIINIPVAPDKIKIAQTPREANLPLNAMISEKTAETYLTFYKTFTPLLFSQDITSSRSFSIFDAYVNMAMLSYYSGSEMEAAFAPFFGNASKEEIATSVKELTKAIGTPIKRNANETGGYSVNSMWYDENNTRLSPKADLETLRDSFFFSLFAEKPNADNVTGWLKSSLPEGYDIPKIQISDQGDAAVVSSYFLKVPNQRENFEKNEKFYVDYAFNGSAKQVRGYRDTRSGGIYYESDTLLGGNLEAYNMDVFLPKDESASPLSIFSDVLEAKYKNHSVGQLYKIAYPYFTIDEQRLDLKKALEKSGVNFATIPALENLLIHKTGNPLNIYSLDQFSKLNFDYTGFYSASVTITTVGDGSAGSPGSGKFEMVLDRPFVFKTKVYGGGKVLPAVVGVIFDPAWQTH